jgi:predicted permease
MFRRIWKGTRKVLRNINAFMTVPLWASLLSLVVACIGPLQAALERMTPIKSALSAAGNCSIPLTLVVLGAYFYSEPTEESLPNGAPTYGETRQHVELQKSRSSLLSAFKEIFAPKHALHSQHKTRGEGRTVFVAILARMVVVPALVLPVIALIAKFELHDIFEE